MKLEFSYSSEGDGLTFLVASVQERLVFENREFVDPRTASLGVKRVYNANTYKKPEPLTYIRFELLLPTTEG